MLPVRFLYEIVPNCFAFLPHGDTRNSAKPKNVQLLLTVFILLYFIKRLAVNLLGLLLTACPFLRLNVRLNIIEVTVCEVKLGTLALTSTNGRACIPRRRVMRRISALTSTTGRA